MPGDITLACAADDRYAPFCAALLHSVLERHAPRQVRMHFLHRPAFSQASRRRLDELAARFGATIHRIEISDARLDGLPTLDRIGAETWFRVLLPELLPDVERVLYLDADALVVDDLGPLWETPMGEHAVAAVANVFEPWHAQRPVELGLPPGVPYFNAGVLLMNLAAWRAQDLGNKLLAYARAHAQSLTWSDQDALNAVLGPGHLTLHPRWNCQNSIFYWPSARDVFGDAQVDEALGRPAIVHFEGPGPAKPWHYLNGHPYRDEYWRHLRATPFPVPAQEGRTLGNVLRRLMHGRFRP